MEFYKKLKMELDHKKQDDNKNIFFKINGSNDLADGERLLLQTDIYNQFSHPSNPIHQPKALETIKSIDDTENFTKYAGNIDITHKSFGCNENKNIFDQNFQAMKNDKNKITLNFNNRRRNSECHNSVYNNSIFKRVTTSISMSEPNNKGSCCSKNNEPSINFKPYLSSKEKQFSEADLKKFDNNNNIVTREKNLNKMSSDKIFKPVVGNLNENIQNKSAIEFINPDFLCKKNRNNRILINVGGVRFETYQSTLKLIPESRLANLNHINSDYDPVNDEYFFDRDPSSFQAILNYFRTGKLHVPIDICGNNFYEELEFWGICEISIQPCCWTQYSQKRDCEETLKHVIDQIQDSDGIVS